LNIVSMVTQGVQFTSVGVNLCHVDVEEANWIHLEGLLAGFVAVNLRQSADAAALQAEIQRRSGQAQETAPGANRGSRRAARGCAGGQATMIASTSVVSTVEHGVFAPHRRAVHEGMLMPLRDRIGVQSMQSGKTFERSFRSLLRPSNRVRGRGAAHEEPVP
jgi:hypothetical protein